MEIMGVDRPDRTHGCPHVGYEQGEFSAPQIVNDGPEAETGVVFTTFFLCPFHIMGVNPKIWGNPPKSSIRSGVFHCKPSILGESPLFLETPISLGFLSNAFEIRGYISVGSVTQNHPPNVTRKQHIIKINY